VVDALKRRLMKSARSNMEKLERVASVHKYVAREDQLHSLRLRAKAILHARKLARERDSKWRQRRYLRLMLTRFPVRVSAHLEAEPKAEGNLSLVQLMQCKQGIQAKLPEPTLVPDATNSAARLRLRRPPTPNSLAAARTKQILRKQLLGLAGVVVVVKRELMMVLLGPDLGPP